MGASKDPEIEAQRRRNIAATRERNRQIARGEIPGPPPVEDRPARRLSHSRKEIEAIERDSGLVYSGTVEAGGKFMDRSYVNGRAVDSPADAGMKILVPVFRRKA